MSVWPGSLISQLGNIRPGAGAHSDTMVFDHICRGDVQARRRWLEEARLLAEDDPREGIYLEFLDRCGKRGLTVAFPAPIFHGRNTRNNERCLDGATYHNVWLEEGQNEEIFIGSCGVGAR